MSTNQAELHLQATLDAPIESAGSSGLSSRGIELVEGSHASISHELNQVLKHRLRFAALLLSICFATFLVLELINVHHISSGPQVFLLVTHIAATAILALAAQRLCADCAYLRSHLWFAEIVIFGTTTFLFTVLSYVVVLESLKRNFIAPISGPWMLLIFTYALFVPNSWKRAAAVIFPIAVIPTVVLISVRITSPDFMELVRSDPEFQGVIGTSTLVMLFSAMIAVGGVKAMRTLHDEAFKARQLGQYQLRQLIGTGGMGEVHLAEHTLLKRPCALKLIRPEKAGDPQTLSRFIREVKSTARLTHWNTVEIYDYGRSSDGTFYYVMEYLPGLNLQQLVDLHGPLDPERAVYLLKQTCEALSEAHAAGLIHRDIKPANIFSAQRGGRYDVAKLLDFGLVRSVTPTDDSLLTQDGVITGSPLYLSPEQAMGEEPDRRTDIYSLGAVLFFLLTGQPPFQSENSMKVILAHASQSPTVPSEIDPAIPDELDEIVLKCLAKEPVDRYQSAGELLEAFSAAGLGEQWNAEAAQQWWDCHGCPKKKQLDEEVFQLAAQA